MCAMSKYDNEFEAIFNEERAPLLDHVYGTMPKSFTCTCKVPNSEYCLKHNIDLTVEHDDIEDEDDFLVKVDL